jgi:hypothetical protein
VKLLKVAEINIYIEGNCAGRMWRHGTEKLISCELITGEIKTVIAMLIVAKHAPSPMMKL